MLVGFILREEIVQFVESQFNSLGQFTCKVSSLKETQVTFNIYFFCTYCTHSTNHS